MQASELEENIKIMDRAIKDVLKKIEESHSVVLQAYIIKRDYFRDMLFQKELNEVNRQWEERVKELQADINILEDELL